MEQLGIEPKLLLAQVVNFLIIVGVLYKLLYKPILTMLARRKKEIEEGLALTEKLRLEEEKLGTKREKALASARQEAMAVIEEAKKQGREAEKDIVAEAHRQAGEIIARAKDEAAQVKKEVARELRVQAVELAVAMAKRLLTNVLSNRDQHTLIAKHIKELEVWAEKQAKETS